MNTRNVKFLAVLAMVALMFSGLTAVMITSDEGEADTTATYLKETTVMNSDTYTVVSTDTTIENGKSYLITKDGFTLTGIAQTSSATSTATVYIVDGASVTLKGKATDGDTAFTIYAVKSGDETSLIKLAGNDTDGVDSKVVINQKADTTGVTIKATFGVEGTSETVRGSSSSFTIAGSITAADTSVAFTDCDITNFSEGGISGTLQAVDAGFKMVSSAIPTMSFGVSVTDYDATEPKVTYYPFGKEITGLEMNVNDSVAIHDASVTLTSKLTTDVVSALSFKEVESSTGITATADGTSAVITISGGDEDADGEIAITNGKALIAADFAYSDLVLTGYADANPYKNDAVEMYATYTGFDLKSTDYATKKTLFICGNISQADVTLTATTTANDTYIATGIYYIDFTGKSNVTIDNTAITSGETIGHKFVASIEGEDAYGWGYEIVDSKASTGSSTAIMSSYPDNDGAPTGAYGEFIVKSDMDIENAKIYAGSKLTVAEGATVKVIGDSKKLKMQYTSAIDIKGTLDATGQAIELSTTEEDPAEGLSPLIEIGQGCTFNHGAITGAEVTTDAAESDDNTPIWGPWTTDLEIDKTFYLSANLIIEDGANFVIKSGGLIILNGYQITLRGNLEIRTGGAISGIGYDQNQLTPEGIMLGKTGILTNSGVIGLGGAAVTISHADAKFGGSVSMQNVTGVQMAYGKYSTEFATMTDIEDILDTDTYTYFLAIGGEANKFTGTGSTSTYKLVLGDNTILSSIEVSTGVSLISATNGNIIAKNSIIEMNGDMSGKFYMESQSAVDMTSGGVKADNTVNLYGYTGAFKTGTAAAQSGLDITGIELKNASGISVVLSKNSYSESSTAYVDYRFEIAGKLAQTSTTKSTVDLVSVTRELASENTEDSNYRLFAGIYVEDALTIDASMNSASLYAIKGDANSRITVIGTISSTTPGMMSFQNANKFYTEFAIKESSTKTVYYQTSFETALDVIDDTVDGIKVYGTFDVPVSFIQESKKGIVLDSTAVVTIPSTISVVVAKGSSMTGAVYSVEGRLTKIDGADMTTPINYTVMTKNDNNDVTYSGLQPAIDDAKAGDVIVLKADASASSLTIPEGVTLDSNNYAITVTKGDLIVNGKLVAEDLTVKGKLIVNGEMESDGTVAITGITTVSGTADLTAAAPTFSDKVTSTGALIVADGVATTNFNGALVSDGTDMVLTTLPGAIAIALVAEENAITVYGTYSDSETIVLPDGMVLTIAAGAKATLGTIEISDATVVAIGTLTATLTGFAGTDAEETSMEFAEAKFTAVSDLSALNTSGANEYKFVLNTLSAGSVEILEGTVTSSAANTVAADQTFTVVSDAVYKAIGGSLGGSGSVDIYGYLNVTDNFTLSSTESTIAGDVNVAKGKTFTINGTSSVTGTITVLGTLDIDGTVTVLGSIDATADDALIDMDGKLNIGESAFASSAGASVTGNIDLEAGKFIQVFPGSTFSSDDLVYTEYVVNGIEYKTVYAVSGTVKLSATISEKEISVTGYDMTGFGTITNWKDSEGNNMTDVNVGKASTIYFDGTALKVTVLPSVGVGMTLYIDGVSYTSGSQKAFSIGTHQVKVTINPGYKGSFDITFNGKPVAGETINLTADMTSEEYVVLTVTGQIEIDPGYTPEPVQEQDNTVTLILLVVLVVLVAAMAIITAMKLMRS